MNVAYSATFLAHRNVREKTTNFVRNLNVMGVLLSVYAFLIPLYSKATVDSRTGLRCATASRKSALISANQPGRSARHQHHTARPRIRADVSCDVAVYSPAFAGYSFQPATEGGLSLGLGTWSAPRWFTRLKTVTHPGTNRA